MFLCEIQCRDMKLMTETEGGANVDKSEGRHLHRTKYLILAISFGENF